MIKNIKNALLLIAFIFNCVTLNTSTALASDELTEKVGGLSLSTPSKTVGEKVLDTENPFSPGAPPLRETEIIQPIINVERLRVGEDASGSINFYNMGNGNAILVLINGRPPLICDAGTVTYQDMFQRLPARQRANTGKQLLIAPMVNDIDTFYRNRGVDTVQYGGVEAEALYAPNRPLSICISHPSLDHFNFIHDIVTQVRLRDPTPLNIHTVLGGHREDYENAVDRGGAHVGRRLLDTLYGERLAFVGEDDIVNNDDYMRFTAQRPVNNVDEIDWLLHHYNPERDRNEPNWYGVSHITHLIGQTDLGFILPVGGNADAHDAKSIITRIRINGWTALTQGDALRRNTDIIRGRIAREEIESDIYHASLQGGGVNVANHTDRANRQDWIQFINPRFSVLTAGTDGAHGHPRADVIQRFFFPQNFFFPPVPVMPNRIDIHQPNHRVHFFNPNHLHLPFHPIFGPNRFGGVHAGHGFLGQTDRGIYTTFSSGKVSFTSQNPIQPVTEYVGNNLPPYLP